MPPPRVPTRDQLQLWKAFEQNEAEFFGLWTSVARLRGATILYSAPFRDDPLFNHVMNTDIHPSEAGGFIREAVNIYRERGIYPSFYVGPTTRPTDFTSTLVAHDFTVYDRMRIMRYAPTGETRYIEVPGLRLAPVKALAVGEWMQVYVEAFAVPATWLPEVRRRLHIIPRHGMVELILGRYAGAPVCGAALYSRNGIGGVYCVGTKPPARRRGFGRALLQYLIAENQKCGNKELCLQYLLQDRLGAFYRRIGFRPEFERKIYRRTSGSVPLPR